MKIQDLNQELFDELGSTKERLKYISECTASTYNDPTVPCSYYLVTHEQLDLLISNTKDLVLDIIEERLDDYDSDAVKYFNGINRVVHDRIERDFP